MVEAKDVTAPTLTKTSKGLGAEVERLIGPSLAAMGYDIVRILMSGTRRARLQIMAERRDGADMNIDDCVAISRAVEAILEVEDPIAGSYELEVSSPGIDRPLTRLADFDRFAGFEARIEMEMAIDGRRRWRGRLLGVDGERVRLATEDGEVALPFRGIDKAKLMLTDELIAATGGKEDATNQGTM